MDIKKLFSLRNYLALLKCSLYSLWQNKAFTKSVSTEQTTYSHVIKEESNSFLFGMCLAFYDTKHLLSPNGFTWAAFIKKTLVYIKQNDSLPAFIFVWLILVLFYCNARLLNACSNKPFSVLKPPNFHISDAPVCSLTTHKTLVTLTGHFLVVSITMLLPDEIPPVRWGTSLSCTSFSCSRSIVVTLWINSCALLNPKLLLIPGPLCSKHK